MIVNVRGESDQVSKEINRMMSSFSTSVLKVYVHDEHTFAALSKIKYDDERPRPIIKHDIQVIECHENKVVISFISIDKP